MIRILAALTLAFAIAPAAQAQAQDDEGLRTLIRGAYRSYIGADATPRPDLPLTSRLRAAETECAALQKRVDAREGADASFGNCSEDYDVLCQCQDPYAVDWSKIAVAIAHPAADRAEAVVTFPAPEGETPDTDPDLKWVFVRTPGGWAVDDFVEYNRAQDGPGQESYRARVIEGIAAMRNQLGLPAWVEPGL